MSTVSIEKEFVADAAMRRMLAIREARKQRIEEAIINNLEYEQFTFLGYKIKERSREEAIEFLKLPDYNKFRLSDWSRLQVFGETTEASLQTIYKMAIASGTATVELDNEDFNLIANYLPVNIEMF